MIASVASTQKLEILREKPNTICARLVGRKPKSMIRETVLKINKRYTVFINWKTQY